MKTAIEVGAILIDGRVQSGLTKYAIERITGIRRSTLNRIEKGEGYPSYAVISMLCDLYNISPAKLFEEGKA